MNHKQRTDEKRIRTIENWIETYAEHVFRFAFLYTRSVEEAESLTVRAFAQTYRRMDISHVYLTDKNAVFGGVVTACRSDEFMLARKRTWIAASPQDEPGASAELPTLPEAMGIRSEDTDGLSLAERVQRLSTDLRIPILLATLAGLELADITRILLLPRRVVQSRLRVVVHEIDPALAENLSNPVQLSDLAGLTDRLSEYTAGLRISEALYSRIRKVVAATAQELQAERRHRGPRWLTYAAIFTGLASILAVDVGVRGLLPARAAADTASSVSQTATGLPSALTGLPVTPQAQFKLNSLPDAASLDHAVFTRSGIYIPKLEESVNAWPSIQVRYIAYADKGKALSSVERSMAAIELGPPIVRPTGKGTRTSADWKVVGWRFDVTGNWAVASVNWMSEQSAQNVAQLYLLYIPTKESNLVATFGNSTTKGAPQITVSAAGSGRVIIQQAVANAGTQPQGSGTNGSGKSSKSRSATNSSTTNAGGASNSTQNSPASENLFGLPVDVYQLSGTVPLHALGKPSQVPAPFGLMQDPSVYSTGILFMGIAGQPSDTNEANTTWYLMSWNGDLTRFVGPPVDGQQHFAIAGSNADFWWAETTPNQEAGTTAYTKWQVLMAPLTGDTAGQSAALNLNGPVAWFGGYGNHVAWIQDTDGQLQLVVASVN